MGRREMGRGVVMSLNEGWAIVMSPDGAFRRVRARPAWRVGDDVLLVADSSTARRAMPWLASVGAAAAAAAVTFTVMSNAANNTPRWYVDISGASQVKLAVSETGRVLAAVSQSGQPLPVRIRTGEPVELAVEQVARAVGARKGSIGSTAVLVNFYAARGGRAPAEASHTLQAAANAVGATYWGADTAVLTRATANAPAVHHQGAGAVRRSRSDVWALGEKPEEPLA